MNTGFWIGIAAFGPLVLFEWVRCLDFQQNRKRRNPWFVIGLLLLLFGWGRMLAESSCAGGMRLYFGAGLTVLGVISYLYVLTAVAGDGTYTQNDGQSQVVSKGIYGWMRHPGVWSFLLVSIGLGTAFPPTMAGGLIFAGMNWGYTILQDRYFFPVTIEGYASYKMSVPFMFPKIRK